MTKNMLFLSLILVLSNVLLFSNAQQACTPVSPSIDPSQLPKLYRQFEARLVVFIQEEKEVFEEVVKYDADANLAQVAVKAQNKTYSRTLYFQQNEIFDRFDGQCQVSKINETKENIFVYGGTDSQGNILIVNPYELFLWNNGVPHKKIGSTTYRGIPADQYQSCQTIDKPYFKASVLVNYYFKTPEYRLPIQMPGDYEELPLGLTTSGIDYLSNKPINHEFQFFEFKSYILDRQELTNERRGEYCEGQMIKEALPQLPNHFSFQYQTVASTIVENVKLYYSLGWKVTREDAYNPYFKIKDPLKVIHDFNSGIDYIINKVRKNCTIATMGTKDDSIFNAGDLDENDFIVMEPPNVLFELDDSYFYAGQRYERGQKANVFVSKRKINPDQSETAAGNQIIVEVYFGKPQEANYEGVDQIEPVWPISSHIYQPGLPEPIIFNIFDFDSRLKRAAFDISECFDEKDKVHFGIRFNYPQGMTQETFDHEFGRRLEYAFDHELFNAIKIYSASPTRLIPAVFQSHEHYFVIYAGFTDIADPIYQFQRIAQKKIKNAGETVVTDSPESCARACILKALYNNSVDPKCYSFDFYLSSNGPRCNLFTFTHHSNPNIQYEEQIVDHYDKVVETFDVADENALFELVTEKVVRKEFTLTTHDHNGAEVKFTAIDIFEAKLSQNDNNGGFTSFYQQFVIIGKDTDFVPEEVKKRGLLMRERTGVSVDECARLCLFEAAFVCELMTYGKANQECKWTSVPSIYDIKDEDTMNLFQLIPTFDLFERDPFYNYAKYPYQVTGVLGVKSVEVRDARECAMKCNKATDIHCRSFNFCQGQNNKYRCVLSELNVHSEDRNPDLVDSAICDHYSRFAIADYQLYKDQTIGVKPESSVERDSVEGCAELCTFEDKYMCRSFEYVVSTSTCHFFRENVVDASLINLNIQTKEGTNHYSREYYVENGVLKKIEPSSLKSSGTYGAGTVIGILICVIIGGVLFGIMSAFVYFKISQKSNILPVMKFTNPNYQSQVNE